MEKEDKKILLKDICARLPYGVKFTLSSNNIYTIKGIDLIVTDEGDWEYAVTAKEIEPIEIEYIKPYLRPMSSMTEDEFAELSNIISDWFDKELFYLTEEPFLEYALSKINYSISPQLFDWFNAHHFDYRNFIKRGLALPAPEGMYNF